MKKEQKSKKQLAIVEAEDLNAVTRREIARVEELIANMSPTDKGYDKLVRKRGNLLNQLQEKVEEVKEKPKTVEYLLRYGLPVLGTVVVTGMYISAQDPSKDGQTWFTCAKNFMGFRN